MRIKSGFVRNGTQIVIQHEDAFGKAAPRQMGGGIVMRTSGIQRTRERVANSPRVVRSSIERTTQENAANLEATLQAALTAEYSKSGTGRFARGIRVAVVKGESGGKPRVSLQIKAMVYRETKFLTNLGNIGRFKLFPVEPYRIFAKGAQNRSDNDLTGRGLAKFITKRTTRGRTRISVGRLKVPRSGNFFTAARQPGRGGGESRILNQSSPQPPWAKTAFFYPLWVNHPGFRRDLLSEMAIAAGSKYQSEVIFGVASTIPSGNIPATDVKNIRLVSFRGGATTASVNRRFLQSTVPSLVE